MSLNLYRRHSEDCKAGRAPDSRTGEFEERKKGFTRCDCSIFASGTLKGSFKRRSTGVATWAEAKAIVADQKSWDDEFPAPNSQLIDLKDADSTTGISTLLSIEGRG
jgi:hypothetical protein